MTNTTDIKTYDARFETPMNLFSLVSAEATHLHICMRHAERPNPGDKVIALTGEVFTVTKVWVSTNSRNGRALPGSYHAHLIKAEECHEG